MWFTEARNLRQEKRIWVCILIKSEGENTDGEGLAGKLRQPLQRELRKRAQGKWQERRTRPPAICPVSPHFSFPHSTTSGGFHPYTVSQPQIWIYYGCIYIKHITMCFSCFYNPVSPLSCLVLHWLLFILPSLPLSIGSYTLFFYSFSGYPKNYNVPPWTGKV